MKRWILYFLTTTFLLIGQSSIGQPDPCLGKKYLSFSLTFNNSVVRHFNKWLESDVNSSTNNFFISQTPSYCGEAFDSLIWILITGNELPSVYIMDINTKDTMQINFASGLEDGYYGRIPFNKGIYHLLGQQLQADSLQFSQKISFKIKNIAEKYINPKIKVLSCMSDLQKFY